jgi:hypothetical protein
MVTRICYTRLLLMAFSLSAIATAQDLAPRAYIITPVHSTAVNLTWSFYHGGLNFNGTIPITGATGTYSIPTVSIFYSFNFFGRSANVTAALPYGVGTFSGQVLGTNRSLYRSGLLDCLTRFSVNLLGGPAMQRQDYARWKQKVILGASIKIVAPTGQYSPTKLVNWGINRWAVKPELGYSERWGHWVLDGYGGVWFFTTNSGYYGIPKPKRQTEAPIGSFEGHLSYSFKQRAWASLDGNFWWGGITALNSIRNLQTKQTSSRIGGTISIPFTKHQSIKASYSKGAYVRFGGDYHNLQIGWQFSWVGRHW